MTRAVRRNRPASRGTIEVWELNGPMKDIRDEAAQRVTALPGHYLLAWHDPRGVSERHEVLFSVPQKARRIAALCRKQAIRHWSFADDGHGLTVFLRTCDSEFAVAALLEEVRQADDPEVNSYREDYTDVVLGPDGKQLQPYRPTVPTEFTNTAGGALLIQTFDPAPHKPVEIGSKHCVYYKGEHHACTVLSHDEARGTWKVRTLLGSTVTVRDALQFVDFPPGDGTWSMTRRSARFSGFDQPFTVIQFGGFPGQRSGRG